MAGVAERSASKYKVYIDVDECISKRWQELQATTHILGGFRVV